MAELEIYRGRNNLLNISVSLSGVAYDLTGCTLWMTAKKSPLDTDETAVFQISSGGISPQISITSALNGQAQAEVKPEDTASLPYSKKSLDFDVQLKDAGGKLYTIVDGHLIVLPNITRASS